MQKASTPIAIISSYTIHWHQKPHDWIKLNGFDLRAISVMWSQYKYTGSWKAPELREGLPLKVYDQLKTINRRNNKDSNKSLYFKGLYIMAIDPYFVIQLTEGTVCQLFDFTSLCKWCNQQYSNQPKCINTW